MVDALQARPVALICAGLAIAVISRAAMPFPVVLLGAIAVLSGTALAAISGTRWLDRYTYSYAVPVLCGITVAMLALKDRYRTLAAAVLVFAAALVLTPSDYRYKGAIFSLKMMRYQWRYPTADVLRLEEVRARYRAAQGSVPPGSRILATGSWICLLDYRRNPIWINDLPGSASPSSGMPLDGDPRAWLDYLGSNGVEYVLYDQGGAYGAEGFDGMVGLADNTAWEEQEMDRMKKYRSLVLGMADRTHYRSEGLWVIDVGSARSEV